MIQEGGITKKQRDMLGQANAENVISRVENALNFHNALMIRRVIDRDDRLVFVSRNREPQVFAQIPFANILE